MLIDFCDSHDMVIGGIFPHRNIDKTTWIAPDGHTENQIDHISINKKCRRPLCDVRNRRGADIFSDHHLVIAKIKIAAIRRNFRKRAKRLDVCKLKNRNVKREFRTPLRNKYEQVVNEEENKGKDESVVVEDSTENKRDKIKATLLTAGEETLGYKEQAKKEWISVVMETDRGKEGN
jgi:hypothetical protein